MALAVLPAKASTAAEKIAAAKRRNFDTANPSENKRSKTLAINTST